MSVLISNVYLAWIQSLQGSAAWSAITALTHAAPQSPHLPSSMVHLCTVKQLQDAVLFRLKVVDYLLLRNAVYMK